MKAEKKIFIAFLLNLLFSVAEFIGGILTGSIAILSDSVHDLGDATGIGTSYLFEKKSKKAPDGVYTYGYGRFSVLGGVLTTLLLLIGSGIVIYGAVCRFFNPVPVNYDGMLILASAGLVVNALAAYFTHGGRSVNQRAVNLHMLEDVLGWAIVWVGAWIMRFTDFYWIDSVLSLAVAFFILFNAFKNLKEGLDIFLMKKPNHIDLKSLRESVLEIDGVMGVHHIHLWTMDGESVYATLHIVCAQYDPSLQAAVQEKLQALGVSHITLQTETAENRCLEEECRVGEERKSSACSHHHAHCRHQ
ncbi:MAG: cation transporter [Clostridiales bacterium]|nr:cation transporter [Clostridiales bacterium]